MVRDTRYYSTMNLKREIKGMLKELQGKLELPSLENVILLLLSESKTFKELCRFKYKWLNTFYKNSIEELGRKSHLFSQKRETLFFEEKLKENERGVLKMTDEEDEKKQEEVTEEDKE